MDGVVMDKQKVMIMEVNDYWVWWSLSCSFPVGVPGPAFKAVWSATGDLCLGVLVTNEVLLLGAIPLQHFGPTYLVEITIPVVCFLDLPFFPPLDFYVCALFLGHIKGVVVEDCVIDMDLLLHSLFILKFFDRLVPYHLLWTVFL